jgi:hypothetical protein
MSSPSNKISNGHSLTCPLPEANFVGALQPDHRRQIGQAHSTRSLQLTVVRRVRNAATNRSSRASVTRRVSVLSKTSLYETTSHMIHGPWSNLAGSLAVSEWFGVWRRSL